MLATERLRLRNLLPEDAIEMVNYRSDERCNQYQRYPDNSLVYIRKFIETYAHSEFGSQQNEQHYAIVLQTNNQIIGDLSMYWTEKDHCFTLGITIDPQHQSHGYGYEILCGVTSYLREQYPSADIVALVEPENTKSRGLFKKLGFTEESYADSIHSYIYVLYGQQEK